MYCKPVREILSPWLNSDLDKELNLTHTRQNLKSVILYATLPSAVRAGLDGHIYDLTIDILLQSYYCNHSCFKNFDCVIADEIANVSDNDISVSYTHLTLPTIYSV